MPGGVIQLAAWGGQNFFLNGNPSMTYFKKVIRTHTNFSMESISLSLNRSDINIYDTTTLKCKLSRHGDLLSQLYFVFEIPEVADNVLEIDWIQHLGTMAIEQAYVLIGGAIVANYYGEWSFIKNEANLPVDRKNLFYTLTGNDSRLTNTRVRKQGRRIWVPLDFWFCDIGNALPLIGLQYHDAELVIQMRPFKDLYTVDGYSHTQGNNATHIKSFLANPTSNVASDTVIDIRAYIEASYVYLEDVERNYFSTRSLDYLIEQVTRIDKSGLVLNNVLDFVLQNPVKEIVWVVKKTDRGIANTWTTFTDADVVKSARIMFNGLDRIDNKPWEYFSWVQPYQHGRSALPRGVMMYSFSLFPDSYNPSGSCNMSRVPKFQLVLELNDAGTNNYGYDVSFYSISYNFLRIINGMGSLAFAS